MKTQRSKFSLTWLLGVTAITLSLIGVAGYVSPTASFGAEPKSTPVETTLAAPTSPKTFTELPLLIPLAATTVPGANLAPPQPQEPEPVEPKLPPEPMTATIAFAGDVLLHTAVDNSARTSKGYNFVPLLSPISDWINGADVAICQLEVPLAPPGKPIRTYPIFAAPSQIIPGLAKTGWDGCATATNHSLDQGWDGVKTTVNALTANQMGNSGMALSASDAEAAQLYRLESGDQTLTIAHLSTSYGFNGFQLPKDKPWAVAKNNVKQITKRAKAARAAGADIVLLSVHYGPEYVTKPSSAQQDFVKAIAKTGEIDAFIGGHPHVVQPIAKVPGGVGGRGMWVAYSLGNLISNMTQPLRETGLVAYVHLVKDTDGARVAEMTWSVVTVDRHGGHKLYMIGAKSGKAGKLSATETASRYRAIKRIVGTAAAEQKRQPTPSGATLTVVPRSPTPSPSPPAPS
ncbi:MAG: CapA family protein [Propionibacteriaceae bacterium]|nr:CapA family protein [Propionibacteriaceae bacterium]